jgi:pyridoxine/pyridoxamine 5'-phosphate oxidase
MTDAIHSRDTPGPETSDSGHQLAAIARDMIDDGSYMTLATADHAGRPWASPVWYAHADSREFFWVSAPETRHSRNLSGRPQTAIVIFDSRAPIGTGQAVYLEAVAGEVTGDDAVRGIEVFSARSQAQGGHAWSLADIHPPARLRLYRAIASEVFVLDGRDQRIAVTMMK